MGIILTLYLKSRHFKELKMLFSSQRGR